MNLFVNEFNKKVQEDGFGGYLIAIDFETFLKTNKNQIYYEEALLISRINKIKDIRNKI